MTNSLRRLYGGLYRVPFLGLTKGDTGVQTIAQMGLHRFGAESVPKKLK